MVSAIPWYSRRHRPDVLLPSSFECRLSQGKYRPAPNTKVSPILSSNCFTLDASGLIEAV